MIAALSWLITLLTATATILAFRMRPSSWIVGFIASFLNAIYTILTHQPAVLCLSVMFMILDVFGYVAWKKHMRK
jgi:nicotinamide riboside transporter PnuC